MLRYCLFILLLLSFNTQAKDLVKLKGRIEAHQKDSIEVSYNDNYLAYYPKKFISKVDKNGNFSCTFPTPPDVYTIVQITYGDKLAEIMVMPGDSLVMSVNAKHFDSTIKYSGRGSNIQNFLAAHTVQKGRMNQYTLKVRNHLQKEPDAFLKAIDNELDAEKKFIENWKTPLPASFARYWTAYYQYYNYFFIQQYPQTHQMLKVRRYTDTIPAANYEVVKGMAVSFNDSLIQVPSYLLYLTGVAETGLRANNFTWLGNDTTQMIRFEDSAYKVAYKIMPDKSLEYYMAQSLYGRAKGQRLHRTEDQLMMFKKRWPQSSYLTLLDKQVGIAKRLAPGQPAPDFEIRKPDGGIMRLSDLKGKVVYLGFWAGWCRQCVGEMMGERMVKDLIRKKPLEFVYASIGTDTAMERMITEKYNIDGLFTNFVGGWDAKEVQQYGVQSVPAYFLIDEDGNFATQKAPLPAQTNELVREIEKLFK